MAGSINKVILVGNLGQEPEVKMTTSGSKIVNLNIATSETWRDKQSGERQEKTEWHRVVIFNQGLAEIAERYLHKGSKVYIEGSLQTRKWTDNAGNEKRTTEVILNNFKGELALLDNKNSSNNMSSQESNSSNDASWDSYSDAPSGNDIDDKIPF